MTVHAQPDYDIASVADVDADGEWPFSKRRIRECRRCRARFGDNAPFLRIADWYFTPSGADEIVSFHLGHRGRS